MTLSTTIQDIEVFTQNLIVSTWTGVSLPQLMLHQFSLSLHLQLPFTLISHWHLLFESWNGIDLQPQDFQPPWSPLHPPSHLGSTLPFFLSPPNPPMVHNSPPPAPCHIEECEFFSAFPLSYLGMLSPSCLYCHCHEWHIFFLCPSCHQRCPLCILPNAFFSSSWKTIFFFFFLHVMKDTHSFCCHETLLPFMIPFYSCRLFRQITWL